MSKLINELLQLLQVYVIYREFLYCVYEQLKIGLETGFRIYLKNVTNFS